MEERPILLNEEMVKAVLEDRKTHTRRPIKINPQEERSIDIGNGEVLNLPRLEKPERINFNEYTGEWEAIWPYPGTFGARQIIKCPYGKVGSKLWVRETWCEVTGPPLENKRDGICYKASCDKDQLKIHNGLWKPSIHMPRWASRITLEITDIRVERIRDISTEDCLREGIEKWAFEDDFAYGINGGHIDNGRKSGHATPTGAFLSLWDGIYFKKGYGWDANPWVWVIEFRRIK